MKTIEIQNLVYYIEKKDYNQLNLLPAFSTERKETIYNDNNKHNGEDVAITNVFFENEDFTITLNLDGSWEVDFWKETS